jgi:hypothetical protein
LLLHTRPPLRGLLTGGAAFVAVGVLQWPLLWVILALVGAGVTAECYARR